MRKLLRGIVVIALALATVPVLGAGSAAAANNAVCMGQLGKAARGAMADVTAEWRTDFLGLGNPGMYAHHLAHSVTACPPTP